MHSTIQEEMDLPPGVWEDHGRSVTLQLPDDFRFAVNLRYLNRSQRECLHRVKNDALYKLLSVDGVDVLLEIQSLADRQLHIRWINETPVSEPIRRSVAAYVWNWFDLSRPLDTFYEGAKNAPILAGAVRDFRGLRLIGVLDLFEALCWSIIGQQINLAFAYTLKRRLVERCGRVLTFGDASFCLFPTPDQVATVGVDVLRALQFTTRKAEYLVGVAQCMADGKLSRGGLLKLGGFDEVRQALEAIRGIGPWSASYVLMRHFRDPSALPIQDAGLQNAVKKALGMERKPTPQELTDLGTAWGPWKAYATFYLWMTLGSTAQ